METTAYTWDSLGTISGATAATLLIVQYIKCPLDRIIKIPTRLLTLFVSFVIMLSAELVLGHMLSVTDALLVLINSFVVALAAMGAYQNTIWCGKNGGNAKNDEAEESSGLDDSGDSGAQ